MSVIAASVKEGCMASDRWCFDGDEHFPLRKVFRIKGDIIGFAGDVGVINQAIKWMRAGSPTSDMPRGSVVALILRRSELVTWTPQDGLVEIDRGWHAIGTGGGCAQAAMLAGADVRNAVRITNKVSAQCGGGVSVYRLQGD